MKLFNKSRIRTNYFSFLLHVCKCFLVGHFILFHQISYSKTCASRNSCSTMNQNFSILWVHFFNPLVILVKKMKNLLIWKISDIVLFVLKFVLKWCYQIASACTNCWNFMFLKGLFFHCCVLISQKYSLNNKIALPIKNRFAKFISNNCIILFGITWFTNVLIPSKKINETLLRAALNTLRSYFFFFFLNWLHQSLFFALQFNCIIAVLHFNFGSIEIGEELKLLE